MKLMAKALTPLIDRLSPDDEKGQRNGRLVMQVSRETQWSASNMMGAPRHVGEMIETAAWREYIVEGRKIQYGADEFDKFCRARPMDGLGIEDGAAGLVRLFTVIGDERSLEIRGMVEGLLPAAAPVGRPKNVPLEQLPKEQPDKGSIGTITSKRGNVRSYTLASLKRSHPELAERVMRGEMSANKAAIAAGKRKKTVQHEATIDGYLKSIKRNLDPADIQKLTLRLNSEGETL